MIAVVSDHPTCPAAAPHVAASAIHPYPLSAHVPEVTTGYTLRGWAKSAHKFCEA